MSQEFLRSPFSRRDLFKLAAVGGLSLLAAPNLSRVSLHSLLAEKKIRWEDREWRKEEVISLAKSMMDESEFRDVVWAGYLLGGNQTGEASFSQATTLFADDQIKLVDVIFINLPRPAFDVQPPVGVVIDKSGPRFAAILKATDGEKTFSGPEKLTLKEIFINRESRKYYRDFLFKFFIAKEVMTVRATELVTEFLAGVK